MSKPQISTRCPENLVREVNDFREEQGLENKSDAVKQLLRRGVEDWRQEGSVETPGEQLARQATTISAVVGVASAVMVQIGPQWAISAAVAFGATTLIFGVLWLSIRVLAGRGDFW